MKKMLLLTMLALTGCAPLMNRAQPQEHSSMKLNGLSIVIANPGPDELTGDRSREGDGPALNVRGVNIQPDQTAKSWCVSGAPESGVRWACNLPDIPAGQQLRVTFAPVNTQQPGRITDAALWAYRPSLKAVPVVRWLEK